MKRMIGYGLLLLSFGARAQQSATLLVGTYTGGSGSAGIYTYRFTTDDARAVLIDSARTENPSFLATAPNGRFVYAVNEVGNGKGRISAFRNKNGRLKFLNAVSSQGDAPCYISIDRAGKNVIAGNYSGGSLALFPVGTNGQLTDASASYRHSGSGPDLQRQEGPHVHATMLSPNERYLLVTDLGTDKIYTYPFSSRIGSLSPAKDSLQLPTGSGPRHLEFHPNGRWVYVVAELTGKVIACRYEKGRLRSFQEISMLPGGVTVAHSADIHVSPDGRFLYASNRKPANSIAIFRIDSSNGRLTIMGHAPSGGLVPRNFTFDPTGRFLLVANQESNNISIFRVDPKSGMLTDTGKKIAVPAPVCLKWLP
jgi:6-phosphogluconolactonase